MFCILLLFMFCSSVQSFNRLNVFCLFIKNWYVMYRAWCKGGCYCLCSIKLIKNYDICCFFNTSKPNFCYEHVLFVDAKDASFITLVILTIIYYSYNMKLSEFSLIIPNFLFLKPRLIFFLCIHVICFENHLQMLLWSIKLLN